MEREEYSKLERREHFYFWNVGRREILDEALSRNLEEQRNLEILDIGCGPGGNLLFLDKYGRVTGLDVSEEALRFAKAKGYEEVIQAGAEKVPLPDGAFDLISCLDVLEHIEKDDRVLREIFRLLKPGGILLLTVPAHPFLFGPHDRFLGHLRRYRTKEALDKIKGAGFTIREYTHFVTFAVPINFLRKVIDAVFRQKSNEARTYDVEPPRFINAFFLFILRLEKRFIRCFRLPLGSSLLVVSRK